MNPTNEIVLIELDEKTRTWQLNEVEKWFEHVLTTQLSFEVLIQKAIPMIKEPHIKEAIEKINEATKHHGKVAEQLFEVIERHPDVIKDKIMGTTVLKVEEGLFKFQEMLAGAVGSWQQLNHLLILNHQAMGAFAVAEQLGLSLGITEIVDLAFPVVHDKTMHQLLLQEYMLEMAPVSILYKENV